MNDLRPDHEYEDEEEILVEDEERARRTGRAVASIAVLALFAIGIALAVVYWPEEIVEETRTFDSRTPEQASSSVKAPRVIFRDATAAWGIDFVHDNGADGRKLLPETMGSGAAFFDRDGDGDPDLFLVNSRPWRTSEEGSEPPTQRLYRNDGDRFVDVTRGSGLDESFYGMGVAAADYDGDGDVDLFVTAVGPNRLFRNDGERFVEVAATAGVAGGDQWSTGAAFLDYDRDGHLDLFVLNYVIWSPEIDLEQGFLYAGLGRGYGPPTSFRGESARLYRNLGDGRFEDVSEAAGVRVLNPATDEPMAKSLALRVCDWNLDGWPDVVVANDTVQNFAFLNTGKGGFREVGAEIGIAFDNKGKARGAMGIDFGSHRNDGSRTIAIGNFANEMTAFYVNEDPGYPTFDDLAAAVGIGAPTRNSLTFGLLFWDYDLDGRQDLVTANGHVEPEINVVQSSQRHAQPLELFWNAGPGAERAFVQATAEDCGPDLFRPIVGRGLAAADVDGDGDLDLLATANGGPARLFINEGSGNRSLRIEAIEKGGKRRAVGVGIEVESAAGLQTRYLGGGGSYLCQSEDLATFGLGAAERSGPIRIVWPDGSEQRLEGLPAGRHRIVQP